MGVHNLNVLIENQSSSWIAVYWKNFVKRNDYFATSKEAFDFLESGSNAAALSTWSIIGPDGVEHMCPYRGGDDSEWEALGKA